MIAVMRRPPSIACLLVAMMTMATVPARASGPASDESAEELFGGGDDDEASDDAERGDIDAALGGSEIEAPALAQEVIVHVVNERSDPNRGLLKLARHRGSTAQASHSAVVVTTHYDVLCTEPCGVPIDISDRPILFFVRDNDWVTRAFRLNEPGEVTLSVKPKRPGLLLAGAATMIILIGIPMLVVAWPKVSMAKGPPSAGQTFKKLKDAKM